MPTYPVPLAGQRLTASLLTSMLTLHVNKAIDETVNNSATLQDDNELFLPVAASATYLLTMFLHYQTGDTPDIKFSWSVPSATTMRWSPHGIGNAVTSAIGDMWVGICTESSVITLGGGGGSAMTAQVMGTVRVSTTAGNLQFRWAQNTATVSDTKVLADSWIELKRIA